MSDTNALMGGQPQAPDPQSAPMPSVPQPVPSVPAPAPVHPMLTPEHVGNLMHNNIAFLWNKAKGEPWHAEALNRKPDEAAHEHSVRAAHLRPVGHEVKDADHNEAYRRAAQSISNREGKAYTPEQVKSVVSEAARNLFPDEHRATHPQSGEPTHAVGRYARDAWNAARYGLIMPAHARAMIYRRARGG